MFKKQIKSGLLFMLGMLVVLFSSLTVQAATGSSLEIGEVRALGNQVRVPVKIHNTGYLTSLQAKINSPTNNSVVLKSFEPVGVFAGKLFRTTSNITGNMINIDLISTNNSEQRLTEDTNIVGYITYELSTSFSEGSFVELKIDSLNAKGQYGKDITLESLQGKIERKMPIGDVIGNDKPTAASSMRILQHINGDFITDQEAFLSADVDGDGTLSQNDALQILEYVSGKRSSFLAVVAGEMDTAVLNSEYSSQVKAIHGRESYEFKRKSGTLPTGIKLNTETGELTGTPTKAGKFTFTIQVTDKVGNTAERLFTLEVIDSNIKSVEKLLPINVKLNEIPNLPKEIVVTYSDKTVGKEKVVWDEVNTSKLGTKIVKGTVGNSGFTTSVEINVVSENYIQNIQVNYFEFMNLHTIVIDSSASVYSITIDNIPTLYEGNNEFSLAISSFVKNSTVNIRVFDRYGNLIETKQLPL